MSNLKYKARHRRAHRPIVPVGDLTGTFTAVRPVAVASATGIALTAVVAGAANATPVAPVAGDVTAAPSTVKAGMLPTTVSVPDVAWTPSEELSLVAVAPDAEAPAVEETVSRDEVRADIAPEVVEETTTATAEVTESAQETYSAPTGVNPAGNDIVSIAMAFQGVPYVWGGTTPAGFDCSGFTQYVYAQAGIPLPRTSGAQGAAGTQIYDINQARPGDLVWHAYGHVGIYAGNGMVIEATTPGDVVKLQPIWGYDAFIRVGG